MWTPLESVPYDFVPKLRRKQRDDSLNHQDHPVQSAERSFRLHLYVFRRLRYHEISTDSRSSDDLITYALWITIELNVVMIVASIPALRPLFRYNGLKRIVRKQLTPARSHERTDYSAGSSFKMGMSKSSPATRIRSTGSEEDMIPIQPIVSREMPGITRTVEVSVTHEKSEATFVHAALVGLPCD